MVTTASNTGIEFFDPEAARGNRDRLLSEAYTEDSPKFGSEPQTLDRAKEVARLYQVGWRTVYRAIDRQKKTRTGATVAGLSSSPEGSDCVADKHRNSTPSA